MPCATVFAVAPYVGETVAMAFDVSPLIAIDIPLLPTSLMLRLDVLADDVVDPSVRALKYDSDVWFPSPWELAALLLKESYSDLLIRPAVTPVVDARGMFSVTLPAACVNAGAVPLVPVASCFHSLALAEEFMPSK